MLGFYLIKNASDQDGKRHFLQLKDYLFNLISTSVFYFVLKHLIFEIYEQHHFYLNS
jgi:uncharacterized protein YutD